MTNNLFIKKAAALFALVGLFLFSGIVTFQLQTAFGWTNPAAAPPGGAGAISVNPITGQISVSGKNIQNLASAVAGTDAVNKNDLENAIAVASTTGGGGGGSIVLYYRTSSLLGGAAPVCPSGWTQLKDASNNDFVGYGPHYLAVLAHDWQNVNAPGGGGGFSGFGSSPYEPGGGQSSGSSYVLKSVAIGSDSVCSASQTATVPFSEIYQNNINPSYALMNANACFTDSGTGTTECNRCIICQK